MNKWLVKSEPDECGIDDFAKAPKNTIAWDGVRNYQARNFMKTMAVGDQVLLYHSSCRHIGVAGVLQVVKAAYPDPTQFNPESPYYDPKSTPDNPRWVAVDMKRLRKLPRLIPLDEIRTLPNLEELILLRRGNRLSVMPVGGKEWDSILSVLD